MLQNYFKTAWRNLVRHKINTTINILGLTLGITVCLIIFLLVRFEFGYDTFHPDGGRIYRVVSSLETFEGTKNDIGSIPLPAPEAMRRELTGLEKVAAFYNLYSKVIIPREGKPNREFDAAKQEEASPIIFAEPQYFDIFPYRWLAGNAATALNEPSKVVLTAKEATRYFGPEDPADWIGRQVIYHDSLPVTVSGIVEDWDKNSDFGFGDFISYSTIKDSVFSKEINATAWTMWDFDAQSIVKLAPGVSPAQVDRQFPAFLQRHLGQTHRMKPSIKLQPLADIHFNERYRDAYSRKVSRPALYGLAGIALFILLIAAINFINLSTAASVERVREIGVRKVLGGRRSAIILQFLSETFLIVVVAVLLSIAITKPLLTALHSMVPAGLRLDPSNPATLLFLALTLIITCLLAGFYPARILSSYRPALSLKGQGVRQLNGRSYLRKSLIVFQFTVSLVFIIGTMIIGRQIHYVLNTDLGFDKDAVIMIRTGWDQPYSRRGVLAEKLREIPGVSLVSLHQEAPTAKGHPATYIEYKGGVDKKGAVVDNRIDASFDVCDTNYIPLFGIQLLAGRNVFASDSSQEFVINETCARQLGFRQPADALGHIVTTGMNDATGPVVGIVKDFHSKSLHEPITPFFLTADRSAGRTVSAKLSTSGQSVGRLSAILEQTEKAWKQVYPGRKFDYSFFDETIARLYDKEQKTARIMNIAMAIAIFISCMGLFGLAAFIAGQRTKEIGIRKVLGATVTDIVSMLSVDFVRLVVIAIVIASPLAWYFMHRWLQDFAYRVTISWWLYGAAGICAIGIALLTVSFQAVRAATANPVESLRSGE